MYKITNHPILDFSAGEIVEFDYEGHKIAASKGQTIAAALHIAGFPIHSHSLDGRERSLECGIGKCGACEMLVDGQIRRVCITKADGVKTVQNGDKIVINANATLSRPCPDLVLTLSSVKTTVAIIGAGPAGLAVRQELNRFGISNIVIDANDKIGGQFTMQTHQFFFFEKEQKYGGMRGFDIAKTLAEDEGDNEGSPYNHIFLNSTVWDILDGKCLGVKNIETQQIFYIDVEYVVVATGAIPFMPPFENDDLPGVYTAAVIQKMMNNEGCLLGKNILTVGAGNIGYLTSYQAMQAGANVVAIIEGQNKEGGFPVQANRIRRLGVPILTSHILLKAIPNEDHTALTGAVIAKCENFKAISGTEQLIEGIDTINICTGLMPDNQILIKAREIFGHRCYGVGDAVRIGEGTSAVLRGKQVGLEIAQDLNKSVGYSEYLQVSKDYIDSQQHPERVLDTPTMPSAERMKEKPFVIIDCLYGFACNPCQFACKFGAITKMSTNTTAQIDYSKCTGCMNCVTHCPGLAIFGYDLQNGIVYLPCEFNLENQEPRVKKQDVLSLTNNNGEIVSAGIVEKVFKKENKTNLLKIKAIMCGNTALTDIRGFILKKQEPRVKNQESRTKTTVCHNLAATLSQGKTSSAPTYICHCDDVSLEKILELIGNRKEISVDEIKHISHLGMGVCRGKRCFPRLQQALRARGIKLYGEVTPRAPMSSPVVMGDFIEKQEPSPIARHSLQKKTISVLIAGGGIAGSALFRYFAEAGYKPLLINADRGSSWRNIAGGRPAFGVPELADIANHNLQVFKDLQKKNDIDFHLTNYVGFAHDEASYKLLEASIAYSDAFMIDKKDFRKYISPYFNENQTEYHTALITKNCWQATPGKVIDTVRHFGIEKGGQIMENTKLLEISFDGSKYHAIVKDNLGEIREIEADVFVNALGGDSDKFARQLCIQTGLFPVKHQAFITRRMPMLGVGAANLDMLIDRRKYKSFSAVYGQQLRHTGQIIGCASPLFDAQEANTDKKINSQNFFEVVSEVFTNWLPTLKDVGIQAVWAGYYIEPRYIIDPELGLFTGLRGHGFMLAQYLAKLYVDKILGKEVPSYFERLKLNGEGLSEMVFK
ncbi:MAG: FAD-dependent oxidoreductase [Bacteroidales bacterium]|jgi:glycine/D-amino acid oxidase-like deaminating enzyme/Fe-S-cluster-containing hydrogenase component 2|nr:FAD-dependent oxidoreductase [Bacteroidales bacterium]